MGSSGTPSGALPTVRSDGHRTGPRVGVGQRAGSEEDGMTRTSPGEAIGITIVQAPACHLCEDAQDVVRTLGDEYLFRLRLVDVHSDEGRALIARHRPAMYPLVLVGGAFLSAGRLPRGKLLKILKA